MHPLRPCPHLRSPSSPVPVPLCLEFTIGPRQGSADRSLREADTYPARVRLPRRAPDAGGPHPSVDGKRSLGPGTWLPSMTWSPGLVSRRRPHPRVHLGRGRPRRIFSFRLSGHRSFRSGLQTYRLLAATVQTHRRLHCREISCAIDRIERFVRQGQTWHFFFQLQGLYRQSASNHPSKMDPPTFLPTSTSNSAALFSRSRSSARTGKIPRTGAIGSPISRRPTRTARLKP